MYVFQVFDFKSAIVIEVGNSEDLRTHCKKLNYSFGLSEKGLKKTQISF